MKQIGKKIENFKQIEPGLDSDRTTCFTSSAMSKQSQEKQSTFLSSAKQPQEQQSTSYSSYRQSHLLQQTSPAPAQKPLLQLP
jgi:hypothetical protein